MSGPLQGKTIFITGGSRGIGLAIATRCAKDGANVVIAAKTTEPHPRLPGTIYTAAKDVEAAGGKALACKVDIRYEEQVQAALDQAVETFGGIDILINNASAISLTGTLSTPMKRYDLMHQINARGSFMCTKLAIPLLRKSDNPHVMNISPPLNLNPRWFKGHSAYTLAKYAMSVWVLGMSEEFKNDGIAFNALWPRTSIATSAVKNLLGGDQVVNASRTPEIMSDAAHAVLSRPSRECTGNFFIDEDVLTELGTTDFDQYAVKPGTPLMPDFFLD
ncbi:MAG: citronellol/citronellal dehydrogenase [Myxococcota bacterium]|jgi:citronellol/citronellal dehydrogenase